LRPREKKSLKMTGGYPGKAGFFYLSVKKWR